MYKLIEILQKNLKCRFNQDGNIIKPCIFNISTTKIICEKKIKGKKTLSYFES